MNRDIVPKYKGVSKVFAAVKEAKDGPVGEPWAWILGRVGEGSVGHEGRIHMTQQVPLLEGMSKGYGLALCTRGCL